MPLVEQLAVTVIAFGEAQRISEIARADDPQQAAIEWMDARTIRDVPRLFLEYANDVMVKTKSDARIELESNHFANIPIALRRRPPFGAGFQPILLREPH